MGKLPAGVDPVVLIVSTVEQAGVQEAEEKTSVAPAGSPEALKEIAWLVAGYQARSDRVRDGRPGDYGLIPGVREGETK